MPTLSQSSPVPALALQVATRFAGTPLSSECLRGYPRRFCRPIRTAGEGSRAASEVTAPDGAPLLAQVGTTFVLRFSTSWQGWLSTTRETIALSKLASRSGVRATSEPGVYQYTIERDASIRISWGHFEVRISSELPPARLPRPTSRPLAHPLLAPVLLASAFLLGLLALIPMVPAGNGPSDIERAVSAKRRQASARLIQAQIHKGHAVSRHQNTAKRARSQERKLPSSAPPETTPAKHPSEATSVSEARHKARGAGIVGVLARSGIISPEFRDYVTSITFDESRESGESYGELAPDTLDARTGAWGHGIRKIGRGKGYETVKTGEYAMGTARQAGADYERRALKAMTRKPKPPKRSRAALAIEDSGISYDAIRGQLGLRKRRLRRCFDDDETRDIGAPGQLQLNLRISSEGEVIDASAQDVDAGAALSCIEKTLLSIHFPSPTNGKPVAIEGFTLRI